MTTILRQQIVDETLTWIGTPFVHQGRVKGAGVDCAGLGIGVMHALNLSIYDVDGYGRQPHAGLADVEADRVLERIALDQLQPADVLKFRIERASQHFGIVTALNPDIVFVHAFSKVGSVVQSRLDRFWRERITGAYRFPGVL
jgi:NlpC/P60 family putative phage cell wall peptidase